MLNRMIFHCKVVPSKITGVPHNIHKSEFNTIDDLFKSTWVIQRVRCIDMDHKVIMMVLSVQTGVY